MLKKKKMIFLAAASIVFLFACGIIVYQSSNNTASPNPNGASQPLTHSQFETAKVKLVQLLEEKDPKASFDYLRNAIKEDTALARECHPLLHHIGHSAYKKYKDFNKAASYQDGLCNSGYTHGAIEAHFMASDDIQATLQTTCSAQDKVSFQQWQCYHGVGHGVMYFTGKDLSQSLSLCEGLPTDFARDSCANGVFMERFIIVSHSGSPASNTSTANTASCKEQIKKNKSDCYFYAPSAYLERNTNDYTGAFDDCSDAEKSYIGTCVYGVGGQAVKENITRPEVARDICKKAPKGYISSCIEGAVSLLSNHNASTTPVEPLCGTVFAQHKGTCTEKIKAWDTYFAT